MQKKLVCLSYDSAFHLTAYKNRDKERKPVFAGKFSTTSKPVFLNNRTSCSIVLLLKQTGMETFGKLPPKIFCQTP